MYRSYIVSILIFCFFIPVLIMLFCYISIINTVKRGNALSAEGDLTDRQRKIERDVTIVSLHRDNTWFHPGSLTLTSCVSSPAGFHSDLYGLHPGVVSVRRGVHVVSLGLPRAQPHQYFYPPLCQVRQLLQPPHLLRTQLQVPQRRVHPAALHPQCQRHGQAEAFQEES